MRIDNHWWFQTRRTLNDKSVMIWEIAAALTQLCAVSVNVLRTAREHCCTATRFTHLIPGLLHFASEPLSERETPLELLDGPPVSSVLPGLNEAIANPNLPKRKINPQNN
jgi:hypothetical protein